MAHGAARGGRTHHRSQSGDGGIHGHAQLLWLVGSIDPLARENARLERENARLRDQLARQAKVLEVQGELSALLSRLAASSADQEPSEPIDPTSQRS
jgi:hypothetical protein